MNSAELLLPHQPHTTDLKLRVLFHHLPSRHLRVKQQWWASDVEDMVKQEMVK